MLLIDGAVLNLTPRVSPHDSAHSVFSILPMILGISSGILRLPMAKCIDRIGRGYGLVMTVAISIAGLLVLTAAPCPEVAVVGRIYWVIASSCLDFIFTVVLADMTSLKNRGMILFTFNKARLKNQSLSSRLRSIAEKTKTHAFESDFQQAITSIPFLGFY